MSKPYAYPSDVTDEEWAFVLPYLLLSKEDSAARTHSLRAVCDAYRYLLRSGCGWRLLPGDLPPWKAVYDQAARWHAAGVFEALIADLRGMIRLGEGRSWAPTAAVLDSRTLKSTPSSEGAAYDGAKRVKGRKLHLAVDTLGHLLAAVVSPADAQDRAVVAELCAAMQAEVAGTVTAAFVDQGYTGAQPAADAAAQGVELLVVKHAGPRRGFVLLPRRWVVEIVFPQITKPDVLTLGAGGEHVADLHVGVGHDDAVDQELDQRAALREGGVGQAAVDACAEGLQRSGNGRQVLLPLGLAA